MLAYRKVLLLILLMSLLAVAGGLARGMLQPWMVLVLFVLNLGMLAAGSFLVCSGLYMKVHCSGSPVKKQIALTFDDGPHATSTPQVLDILKANDIKAAFFLKGKNIAGHEAIIRRMTAEGHIPGNHSFSHRNTFGFYTTSRVMDELKRTEDLVEKVTGKKMKLFRPPFGVTNPNIARAARLLDYTVVGWSIRSLDTVSRKERTINRVVRRLKPGKVVLLHDDRPGIDDILEAVIREARASGFAIVPLDELLGIKAYR